MKENPVQMQVTPDQLPYDCSIIITSYNSAAFIEQAIDSAVAQKYLRKNIIVVDDCSQDNSVAVIEKKLSEVKDVPVQLLKTNKNSGVSCARNIGIYHSVSPFICYLDGDDYYYPDKVSYSIAKMIEYPAIGVCYSDYDMYNRTTGIKKREIKAPYCGKTLIQYCMVATNSMIRRDVFDKVGLFDENMRLMEDYDLWLRASTRFMFCHIPIPLWCYTEHSNNITLNTSKEEWARVEKTMKERFLRSIGQI